MVPLLAHVVVMRLRFQDRVHPQGRAPFRLRGLVGVHAVQLFRRRGAAYGQVVVMIRARVGPFRRVQGLVVQGLRMGDRRHGL